MTRLTFSFQGMLLLGFLLIASASTATLAQDYEESFTEDFGGWQTNFASIVFSGGVDDSPWMRGVSPQYPGFQADESFPSAAPAALLGDLRARYGNLITYSYFTRTSVTDGIAGPAHHELWGGSPVAKWRRVHPEGDDEWLEVTYQIDTDWSDAEAQAAGWNRFDGDTGTTPWSEMFDNVFRQRFYAGDCPFPCQSQITHFTGIDEVRITGAGLAAGRVTDLRLDKDGDSVALDWGEDCGDADRYSVYYGFLTTGYLSLRGLICGLTETSVSIDPPPNFSTFYLIVPSRLTLSNGFGIEGSYGTTSEGVRRETSDTELPFCGVPGVIAGCGSVAF